jgi:predicted metal-dependent hydrolase
MWPLRQHEFDLSPAIVNGREYGIDAVLTDGRTATASVRDGRIVIRIPRFARRPEAEILFLSLRRRVLKALKSHPERFEKHPLVLKHGSILNILGRDFPVIVGTYYGSRCQARVHDGFILVKVPYGLSADYGLITKLVLRSISRSFLPIVHSRVEDLNRLHFNAAINTVSLKNTCSRWGSYSKRTRSISLSIRLLFAPSGILDYVIVHELAHSREHNHSPRFWSHVSGAMPDYKERRRWLSRNGDLLGIDRDAQYQKSNPDRPMLGAGITAPA